MRSDEIFLAARKGHKYADFYWRTAPKKSDEEKEKKAAAVEWKREIFEALSAYLELHGRGAKRKLACRGLTSLDIWEMAMRHRVKDEKWALLEKRLEAVKNP